MNEKLWYCKNQTFLVLLLFFNFAIIVLSNEMFDVNIDKINDVYHRAALMALLKARGTSLLKSGTIPYSEQIIYKQCLSSANTPIKLAKCVTQLLDIKDNTTYYQQKDSLSAIEKLGEIFFGNKFSPKTKSLSDEEDEPLRRIIPTPIKLQHFEVPQMEKFNGQEKAEPIAVKERYYVNDNNGKEDFHPIVRSKVYRLPPHQQRSSTERLPNRRRYRTDARSRRWKREQRQRTQATPNQKPSDDFQILSNLEKLTKYYKMLSYCESYFKKANQDNSNFVSAASKLPYKFEIRKDETMSAIENVFEALESVVGSEAVKSKYSLLSPRLFSILPSESDKRKHLLSPSLFSFHENDGFFSLPTLLKKFNFDNKAENEWIETLLEISGASKTLDDLVKKMEPEMKEMNERVFPTVLELERQDKNWEMVVSSYSEEQKVDIAETGYAFLEPEQLQLVYSGKDKSKLKINLNSYAKLSKEQRQKRIDDDIRRLAKFDQADIRRNSHRRRRRRQVVVHPDNGEVTVGNNTGHHDYSQEAPGTHGSVPHLITLSPWAGGYRVGEGFAFEVVTLSPHAFFLEVAMPAAIGITTLGPRAFIAAILSPNAIVSRILSPAAFEAEILSPRALMAYVLSPEAMVAEILTPKFLEARVLSPEALIVQVLSPSIIAPRIASPEAGALLILSPSILSPRIQSGHTLTVEILSPHILGGGHSSHEDAEQGIPHQHSEDEHKDHRDGSEATQIVNHGVGHGGATGAGHGTATGGGHGAATGHGAVGAVPSNHGPVPLAGNPFAAAQNVPHFRF